MIMFAIKNIDYQWIHTPVPGRRIPAAPWSLKNRSMLAFRGIGSLNIHELILSIMTGCVVQIDGACMQYAVHTKQGVAGSPDAGVAATQYFGTWIGFFLLIEQY